MPKIIIALVVLWVQLFFILTVQEIEIDNETEFHILPNDIIPEHYNIDLNLVTIEKGFFTGTCYIFLEDIGRFTGEISFHVQLPYVHIEPSSIHFLLKSGYTYRPTLYIYYVKSQVLKLKRFMPFKDVQYSKYPFETERHILKIPFNTTLYDDEDLFKTFYTNKDYKT